MGDKPQRIKLSRASGCLMQKISYQMTDPRDWTRRDEFFQRIGNFWRLLNFAFMALRVDSTVFAIVFLNASRDVGDGLIGVAMKDGRRINSDGGVELNDIPASQMEDV